MASFFDIGKDAYDRSKEVVDAALAALRGAVSNMEPSWKLVVPIVLRGIGETFDKERGGWPALAKRTQAERQKQGFDPSHPILQRTGELKREATGHGHHLGWVTSPSSLTFQPDPAYDKFKHHTGFMLHNAIRVPARPFFLIYDHEQEDIVKTIALDIARQVQAAVR